MHANAASFSQFFLTQILDNSQNLNVLCGEKNAANFTFKRCGKLCVI